MKLKFSLSANLELKFCQKIYTKITKVIPGAFLGDFLLKIGIIWYRDIKKISPSINMRARPLPLPQLSVIELWNLCDSMKMHDQVSDTVLQYHIKLYFSIHWNRPNRYLAILDLLLNCLLFFDEGFIYIFVRSKTQIG